MITNKIKTGDFVEPASMFKYIWGESVIGIVGKKGFREGVYIVHWIFGCNQPSLSPSEWHTDNLRKVEALND